MFSFLYDFCLLVLSMFALPKLLYDCIVKGKYRNSFLARLGFNAPVFSTSRNNQVIWLHAVSVGEAKAASSLFHKIKATYPDAHLLISTTTETGQAEAKRCMPGAAHYFYLPFDFSWIIKKVIRKVRPDALILVETDFWYHLLKQAKEHGAKIILVNGKMSNTSFRRLKSLPFFANKLFGSIDCFCVQNTHYRDLFLKIGVPPDKLTITGNLKLDLPVPRRLNTEIDHLKRSLGILAGNRVLVIASTHQPEEALILSYLQTVDQLVPGLKIILAPRHPERFEKVYYTLKKMGISVGKYSGRSHLKGDEKVILADCMGLLSNFYQCADAAIVGGSFVKHVGGHNIFEPVQYGVPTLFGPWMQAQEELKDIVLSSFAAKQVDLPSLPAAVVDYLQDEQARSQSITGSGHVTKQMQGAANRTFLAISSFLQRNIDRN